MKLKKDSHLFIPFDKSGKNLVGSYGSPYIYQSKKTAMKYTGRDAHELVEYAPIIHCVDTGDFCSRGERRTL